MQTIDVKGARLSPQQSRLWHWAQDKSWYRVQCALEITGDFEPGMLQQALQHIVEQHTILHTTFVPIPGIEQPMQAIGKQNEIICPLIDLEQLNTVAQQASQEEHWHELLHRPFDLEHGPLLYAEVLRLSPQSHVLMLSLHALCADASTLKHLSTAVLQAYSAYMQNKGEIEGDDPLQYVNVTAWLNELLQDEEAEEHLAYWRRLDLSHLNNSSLPFQTNEKNLNQGDSSVQTLCKPQQMTIPLPAELQRQLQIAGQHFEVPTEAILLAAWQTLLWRLTGDQDLSVGVLYDGRPYEELVDLLGPYARMIPMSISLTNQRTFGWILQQTGQLYQQAIEKQLYFTWEAVNTDKREPVSFPISFAYETWPEPTTYGSLTVAWQRQECWLEPSQLQLRVQQSGESTQLQLAYNPAVFSEHQMQRLARHLIQFLKDALAQPELPIGALELLTPEEQETQRKRWQGPQHDWPFVPLHQRFQAQVQRQPMAPALHFDDILLSYQEVERTANQLAHLLLTYGISPGQRIALYQRRDQWAIISLLAVLKAGGCYVPLDEDLPPPRVQLLLRQMTPAVLICSRELYAHLDFTEDDSLPIMQVETLADLLEGQPTSPPQVSVLPQQAAYVIYTSGTTGTPKGVQISQHSISNYTQALCQLLEVQAGWHIATVSSLAADLGNTAIFCALTSGGCLHLLPYTLVTDGAAFASYVQRHPLDMLKIVPTHLQALLATGARGIIPRQRLILGGEALPWTLIEQLQQDQDIPETCRLYNHYGPTETTIGALVNPLGLLRQIQVPAPQKRAYSVPIGHPIANLRVAIWDTEHHMVPQGVKGELYIAGAGVALGYLGDSDLTASRFLTIEQTRWYRTGDVVYENEEGLIEFIGRRDAQVKLRGYRIELSELEEQLRNLPAVRDAVAQLRTDGPDEQPYLIGYIIPWKQPGPEQQEIRGALAQQLPSYLIPRNIVCLEQFPLSPNGKLDRRNLPAPPVEGREQTRVEPIEEARTPIEGVIQQIWRQVLGAREIGRNDDFFLLGGHSLLGTRMIAQVRTAFGVEVPITWLFETPTVAELSQRIEETLHRGHGLTLPPLVPTARDQILPLSFAQQRLWFLDQLEPGSTAYMIPRVIHLQGPLDRPALLQALHTVIMRHENLRTTFPSRAGEPWQQISPQPLTPLSLVDLRFLSPAARKEQATRLTQQEVTLPFDLAQGPLLRSWLLLQDEEEQILLLTLHHIISDGWSSGLMVQELSTLYLTLQRGETPELPMLPIQYADFALWQRSWLQGEVLKRQLDYWKTQLAGLSPLNLPTDHPRKAVQSFRGASQRMQLPLELSQQLQELSRREGATLFMTLLSAFQILLARYSGQKDIAVGTPIANRRHEELEGLIGFFVNMLVLRSDLSDNPSFLELLKRVRATTLEAYTHQDVPFEQVVEAVPSQRTRSPLFQVAFVLQNAPEAALTTASSPVQAAENNDDFNITTAKFELTMILSETKEGLHTTLEYTTDLFTEPFIQRFLSHWQQLLSALVANPAHPIDTLPLLPAAQSTPVQLDWHQLPASALARYEEALARPLTNTYLTVLDEARQPVPGEVVGLLYIGNLHGVDLTRESEQQDSLPLFPDPWSQQPPAYLYCTGERVRLRASGELEYLDRLELPRHIVLDGSRLSLNELEEHVRRQTRVHHCRLLARTTPGGLQELVAYMVPGTQGSPEIWQEQVRASLPEAWVPTSYIPISHLPLTPTGEVDDQALLTMAPLTAQTLAQWEHFLRQQEGVEQVAVLIQEPASRPSPLHLADLLPEWGKHAQFQSQTQEESASISEPLERPHIAQAASPSLAVGRSLHLDQDITTLPQMLLRAALPQNNSRLIYILPDGSELVWTYQQLLAEAQEVLAGLRQLGLRPQDKVIIQVEWCQEFLPVLWGCLLGGMVVVPISIAPTYAQPTSASSRLFHAWQMLGQPIVVAGSNIAAPLQALAASEGWHNFSVVPYSEVRAASTPDTTYYQVQPDDLALILLTSGSTGASKGVMQRHHNLLSQIQGMIQQLGCIPQQGVTFNWMPLDHVGGVVMLHFHALYLGDTQVHTLPQNILQDPLCWLDYIDRYRATTTWAPNFAFGLLNEHAEEIQQRHWDLSSMRNLINAGEAIVAKVTRTFMQLMRPHGLSTSAMLPVWGMSETCSGVTFSIFPYESDDSSNQMVEVGEPIPGFSVRLVDKDDQIVEEGRIGRLQVSGPSVTEGYYQNSEATEASFTADGWFDTGDLGLMKAGQLTITGRAKDTIIINGINYYGQEIEAAVEELEEVETSYTAAIAVRNSESTTDQLAVFVVSRLPDTQVLDVLKKVRAKVIARVGITPTYVLPVAKDDIPKTGIGKIQRTQLKQAFEAGQYQALLKDLDRQMGNANTLPNWFYRKSWQKLIIEERKPQSTEGVILALVDDSDLGKTLYEHLLQQQQRFILIEAASSFKRLATDHYQIDPTQEADYHLLGTALTVQRITITSIIHLWGYHAPVAEDPQNLVLPYTSRLFSLLWLVQTLEKGWRLQEHPDADPIKLVVVSPPLASSQDEEALPSHQAPLLGLLKTAMRELSWLQCVHVEVPPHNPTHLALSVLHELFDNQQEPEVAYRDGQRFVTRLEPVAWSTPPAHPSPLLAQGFYLLSGGLGGLGYELACHLLQEYQAHLLLIGRTPLTDGSDEGNLPPASGSPRTLAARFAHLQTLAQQGGAVRYAALDVCDLKGLQQAVAQLQQEWELPLEGIFHLAGTFHEQVLLQETAPQLLQTLRPKVEGTWTLHQLLKDRPGSLFVSFSSVNAFFGGRSVGAYAAANDFLESFAHFQRVHCGLQSYCISWSMWDEIGMSLGYQFKAFSQAQGFQSIPFEQGWYSLLSILHHDLPSVLVGLDGTNPQIRYLLAGPSAALQEAVAYVTPGLPSGSLPSWPAWWGSQPHNYHVITRTSLPLTATGEVDIMKLGNQQQAAGLLSKQEPRTQSERELMEIWRQVLKTPQIGVHDNFFELGGHSLVATQVVARLQRVFKINLPVRTLFEHPTIADLAQLIESQQPQSSSIPPLIAAARDQDLPLSFAQQRLWFLDQLEPGSSTYIIPQAIRLQGPLDRSALLQAFHTVIMRHENLRTTFPSRAGEPWQQISPHSLTYPFLVDLRFLSSTAREEQASYLTQQEATRPFDLAQGPLLRCGLLQLADDEHILLLTLHHIISDGWSSGRLIQELSTLYLALQRGETPELPSLPIQYADFALWQRSWLQGEVLEQQLNYWRQRLAGIAPLELPIDHPRPPVQSFRGARQQMLLPLELSQQLQDLSQREGVTLFMTLLAAFQVLLARYSGQGDIAVGTPIANRTHEQLEKLIGFFVNMLTLRSDLSDNPTFLDLLKQVRTTTLEAYTYQDVPFEQIVELIPSQRTRSPLFQVVFVLQNAPEAPLSDASSPLHVVEEEEDLNINTAKFELTLIVSERTQGLHTTLEYTTDLFTETFIAHFLAQWQQVLTEIVAAPNQRILSLSLLPETQRHPTYLDWHLLSPATVNRYEQALDRPLTATTSLIVLDEALQPVPSNIVGQLYIALDLEHESAPPEIQECLIPDPWRGQSEAWLYPAGDRVRYRASGALEYLDRQEHSRQLTLDGALLSLDDIEEAIRRQIAVQGCRLLTRNSQSGHQELVAYVVTNAQSFSSESWQEQLRGVLPEASIPRHFLPVSNLPLTQSGEVDDQALLAMAPLTTQMMMQWEEYLRQQEGVEQVAVVIQEYETEQPPLHLSDLLPDWEPHAQIQQQTWEEPESASEQPKRLPTSQARLSINQGGILPEQEVRTLPQALLRATRCSPEARLIYILPDGSELVWTYQHLLTEAQQVLAGLQQLGIRPQDKVILQVEWCHEFLPVFWGCLLGGIVPVPASIAPTYEQPTSASSRLHYAWQMLDRPLVIAGGNLGSSLQALADNQGWDDFRVVSFSSLQKSGPLDTITYHESQPEDIALILLTSGSTGTPKGVMQQHISLLSMAAGVVQSQHFSGNEVTLNWMPLDHVGGIVMFHLRDVYLGCSQIHVPTQTILQDPLKWLDLIDYYRVTITWAPNFAFGLVNDQAQDINRRHWDLSSLHFILNGGEAIVSKIARRFLELLQPHGLSPKAMHPAWGMSETSSGIVFSDRFSLDSTSDEDSFVEVGEPIPGISIRIVDAQDRLVNEGAIGHLQVKGATVTAGYYQNPEVNQEVFHADGWFDTGDLGLLRDGRLAITGRAKDVIIVNGINYYSQEIEAAVEELEEVETSYTAAIAVRDGQSTTDQLAIFLVSREEDNRLLDVLRKVRARVSAQMGITPTYVLPVTKDDIPKTGIGKIQRTQLKQAFEAGQYRTLLHDLDRRMGNANTLPNWFYRTSWHPRTLSQHQPQPASGVILLLLDEEGVGAVLAEHLRQQQHHVITVEPGARFERVAQQHYRLDPGQKNDYQQLSSALQAERVNIQHVVHLWGYQPHRTEPTSAEHLLQAQQRGVLSLWSLVQALEPLWQHSDENVPNHKLVVVSHQTQAVREQEDVAYEQAPILGLLTTLNRELPWLQAIHLDLHEDQAHQIARRLLDELWHHQEDQQVAYRGEQRLVARLEQVEWSKELIHPLPLQQKGVYLLSGGLGGVGYELACQLLQDYQAHLLLLGRTPITRQAETPISSAHPETPAARLAHLHALSQHGGAIRYEAVDVCDLEGIQRVVNQAQQEWGHPLDGIFHLAGTFHEQVVLQETPAQIEQTLHPKVLGTWTLHQLLKDRPGTLFVSFSSVNAFFGGRSVGAYAAANAFLESFTHYQRVRCSLQSYCLAWSMWDETGMSRGYQLKAFSQAQGYQTITPRQGWHSLLTVLHHEYPTILVGLDGTNQHIRPLLLGSSAPRQEVVAYVAPGLLQEDPQRAWPSGWGTQPNNYRLVTKAALPLTETGDIDLALLGGQNHTAALATKQEPRTETEKQILEIWSQVLKNPQMGVLDNFFELGGHSLLATQVVARMQRVFQTTILVRTIFEHPTVAALAQLVESQQPQSTSTPPLVAVARNQPLPLSFAQQRLWFLNQLEPESTFYNIPGAFRLQGPLSVDALRRSWQEIIQRHEVLRTTFNINDNEVVQTILPGWPEEEIFLLIDLSQWPEQKREQEVQRWIKQEAQHVMDLAKGPLVRLRVLKLEAENHIVLATMHHIISDGWSMSIFQRELTTLYNAFVQDKPSPLAPLPLQYADFALWQRNWLQGEVLEKELAYWREQLAGIPEVIELPLDHSRPAIQSYHGAQQSIAFSVELMKSVKELAQQADVTLFMAMLATFQVLLWRYSGQEDIVVGTPIANRNRVELEGLIGFFANTLVLRTNLGDNPTFRAVLAKVREVTLGAYSHQDVPFEKLVEMLRPERKTSHTPLIQAVFTLPSPESTQYEFTGLTIQSEVADLETSKFDLACHVINDDQAPLVHLTYNRDLFEPATIQQLLSHWLVVLENMISNPDQQIGDFPLVSKEELEQFLSSWKGTEDGNE